MHTLIIGARTLTGASAKSLSERLCNAHFPLRVEIRNHAPFNLSLPEGKVFLRPVESREFIIETPDAMARMIGSAEQIAELNRSAKLIAISSEAIEEGSGEEGVGETEAPSGESPETLSSEEKGETEAPSGGDSAKPSAPETSKRTGSRKSGSKK